MGAWADGVFAKLTLAEKVGQVICYRATDYAEETIEMARQGLVGAVSPPYYKGMMDLDASLAFQNALNEASPVPVMFITSFAQAISSRGSTPLPAEGGSMALGATRDADLAYRHGLASAIEVKATGVDCVWCPCVDVNTNPDNPIIGTRAFSDRADLVSEMSVAMVRGMQEGRVIPGAKHFPGHGDTAFDTHRKIGVVAHDRARLDAVELAPYRALIAAGLRGIETAHIIYPALDDTPDLPATFSRKCIYDILRTEMGFEGLIISDSLTMKAIKDHYSVADAAIRTFNSGHDIILQDYDEPPLPTHEAMLKAVTDGVIPMAELDASVRRVLEHKEWARMHERRTYSRAETDAVFRCPEHMALCKEIFDRSVTVLENAALPIAADAAVGLIATRSAEEGQAVTDFALTVENSRETFFAECRARLGDVTAHTLNEDPTPEEVAAAVDAMADCDCVLFATMPRIVAYKELSGNVGAGQPEVVRRLQAQDKRVALCVFGTPYVIPQFPRAAACLTSYYAGSAAVEGGVRALFGEITTQGKLPIDLSDAYPFGHGL